MTWDKLKVILGVITSVIFLIGIMFTINNYFAKNVDVEVAVERLEENDKLIKDRVDISIVDDQIFQQEQQIYRIKDWAAIERKEREMTSIEKETLEKQEKRLEELRIKRERKIKDYEQRQREEL
jgi:hypothetical protein